MIYFLRTEFDSFDFPNDPELQAKYRSEAFLEIR